MSVALARAGLTDARRFYLAALQRACDAGTPVNELRTDIAATHSASEQLVALTVAERLTPACLPAPERRSLADAPR